jgi:hypothetical protein
MVHAGPSFQKRTLREFPPALVGLRISHIQLLGSLKTLLLHLHTAIESVGCFAEAVKTTMLNTNGNQAMFRDHELQAGV